MGLRTDREYDEPCVHQLAVFMHNRIGQLRDVLARLEEANVTVHALSIVDAVDYAVARLVTDKIDAARRALKEAGFPITETMLLAVEIPDEGITDLLPAGSDRTADVLRGDHQEIISFNVSMVFTASGPTGLTDNTVTPASLNAANRSLMKLLGPTRFELANISRGTAAAACSF